MATITLTSKRQATFPVEACRTLGIKPGDTLELEPRMERNQPVWVLRTQPRQRRQWVGCLHSTTRTIQDHSMTAVRESIAAGRRREK